MRKNDSHADSFMYEIRSNESDGSPTGTGGCLPWILGGPTVIGILSKIRDRR